jgi:hypothetical protein
MNDEQRRMVLRNIILMRMDTISQLDQCRFILEEKGANQEKRINILLDRLNNLNNLERELKRK